MGLTKKQKMFVENYLQCWNATEAAKRAGYSERTAYAIGHELLKKLEVSSEIKARIDEKVMKTDQILSEVSDIAGLDISDFVEVFGVGAVKWDFEKAQKAGKMHLIKTITPTREGLKVEFHDKLKAIELIGKHAGVFDEPPGDDTAKAIYKLPADSISPNFLDVYRDIWAGKHREYILSGGRGSAKSSFGSLIAIEQLLNNPQVHGLALRQVKDTLRDSIYNQLVWAIDYLRDYFDLEGKFKCTTNPLEIVYKPTGQKIYFRGGADPLKIKSIKPPFGYIGVLLFEELDQFRGTAAVRSIVQSAIRGGDHAVQIKVINPPRSRNNWAIKDMEIPNENRLVHRSNYLEVPPEWLGKAFLDEAEFLKEINPDAYQHEYMGESIGIGGLVFENVELRKITDEEIAQFDHVCHGLDFGYYPDPAHYARCHYDAARLTLYIYGEVRAWKASNRRLYDLMVAAGLQPSDTLICDSAEPKSIADLREYGAAARGAEKGPGSVEYSIKFLQGLKKIVIDNGRCPHTAEEFINYEYEMTKDGEYISSYPDKDDHAIAAVRYATNLIWRRRGTA